MGRMVQAEKYASLCSRCALYPRFLGWPIWGGQTVSLLKLLSFSLIFHSPSSGGLVPSSGVTDPSLTSEGSAMPLPPLTSAAWGVELHVAHPGTGRELWYCVLYSPQIRNKHHHRVSAFMSHPARWDSCWLSHESFIGISIAHSPAAKMFVRLLSFVLKLVWTYSIVQNVRPVFCSTEQLVS